MKTLYLSLLSACLSIAAFSQQFSATNPSSGYTGVSLTAFDAEKDNNGVELTWNAVAENNMSSYEIQKSTNGSSFYSIGTVTAQNNSTPFKYNFSDATPVDGKNYYRLSSIDAKGNISVSKVVVADNSYRKADVMILPNPVRNGVLNLQLSNISSGRYSISLYSNDGKKIFARSLDLSQGTSTQLINLPSTLGRGLYFLQVSDGISRMNKEVILQ